MRILLFSSTYPPLIGGVETVTRRLARELKDRGHDVFVATNRYPWSLPAAEEIDNISIRRWMFPNLLPSPGRRSSKTIVKQILSLPLAVIQVAHLYQLIQKLRPAVVNAHYFSYPVAYALIAARFARVPVVLCFHGSDVPGVPYPATYGWAARWACIMANEVICCSENLRGYLLDVLPLNQHAKVTVSHYGVDESGKSPVAVDLSTETPSSYAVILARLVEKKGVEVAIRAMSRLKSTAAQLVVLGSGPLESKLKSLVKELDIREIVHFAGSVPHAEALAITRRTLFVVVPSHWEAFGQVCLEAMMAGKAVIATNSGGPAEIIVDGATGLLVPPGNEEALAHAMNRLLDEPELAQDMGRRGRERAEQIFTWAKMAERYEAAFDGALNLGRVNLKAD